MLKALVEQQAVLAVLNAFDAAMAAMNQQIEQSESKVPQPLWNVARRLFDCAKNGFFLLRVCELKLSSLAKTQIHAIETQNALAIANTARALVEHLASMAFVGKALERLLNDLQGQNSETKILAALARAEEMLHRCYYGTSPKGKGEKNTKAPHVESECLPLLKTYVADIDDVYAFLCEYVHPNYGSNALVSMGKLGQSRLAPPPEFNQAATDRICNYCCGVADLLKHLSLDLGVHCIRINDLVNRSFVSGAKLTNVFSSRPAKPEGDGRSEATAFHFPRARTKAEAMEMTYSYMRELGVDPSCMKVIGSIREGFLTECWQTPSRPVWFKYKMTD